MAAGLVQRIVRVDAAAQVGHARPIGALALGLGKQVVGHSFQGFAVLAFGVNLRQFDLDGCARWVVARCFLENFLGLQVSAIGQVHIGFGDGINIAAGIELAR